MAAGARLNPRIRNLEDVLDLSKAAVDDATIVADTEYRRQEVELFASEGASGGNPWPELSPAYKRWKRKRFPGRKILALKGNMREAFSLKSNAQHIAEAFRVSRWKIRLGAQGPLYYRAHADGLGNMPKRDPQQRTPEQEKRLEAAVSEGLVPHVMRALRARLGFSSSRGSL